MPGLVGVEEAGVRGRLKRDPEAEAPVIDLGLVGVHSPQAAWQPIVERSPHEWSRIACQPSTGCSSPS